MILLPGKCLRANDRGVTLVELLIVIVIIGLFTTAALKAYDTTLQTSRVTKTMRTLDELAAAIVGNPDLVSGGVRIDYGYVGDLGKLPERLQDLVERPSGVDTALWRGPYVLNRVAENPTSYAVDAWGDSLMYDPDSLTISSRRGFTILEPSRWLVRRFAQSQASLFRNAFGGIVYDSKGNVPDSTFDIRVALVYPQNGRLTYDTYPTKLVNGNFNYPERIPVGNHKLYVRFIDTTATPYDTIVVEKSVSVAPGARGRNWAEVHLPLPLYR